MENVVSELGWLETLQKAQEHNIVGKYQVLAVVDKSHLEQ